MIKRPLFGPLSLALAFIAAGANAEESKSPQAPTTRVDSAVGGPGLTVVAPTGDGGSIVAEGCTTVVVTDHATVVRPSDEPARPCERAALVHFRAKDASVWWTIRDRDGAYLCTVPCSAWVAAGSGLSARRENATYGESYSIADPPAGPGDEIVANIEPTRAGGTGGKLLGGVSTFMFGLTGVSITAIALAGVADPSSWEGSATVSSGATPSQRSNVTPAAGLAIGGAFLALSGLTTYWTIIARDGGVRVARDRNDVRPMQVRPKVALTPRGLGGTF